MTATDGAPTAEINLDRITAMRGQAIANKHQGKDQAKRLDREVTRLLAVLQEHGVYAALLYLYTKTDAACAPAIKNEVFALMRTDLSSIPTGITSATNTQTWPAVSAALVAKDGLLSNLDNLFLVRDVIEQTLIYARFGAKAAVEQAGQNGAAGGEAPSP